jgi:hypothetical protein
MKYNPEQILAAMRIPKDYAITAKSDLITEDDKRAISLELRKYLGRYEVKEDSKKEEEFRELLAAIFSLDPEAVVFHTPEPAGLKPRYGTFPEWMTFFQTHDGLYLREDCGILFGFKLGKVRLEPYKAMFGKPKQDIVITVDQSLASGLLNVINSCKTGDLTNDLSYTLSEYLRQYKPIRPATHIH